MKKITIYILILAISIALSSCKSINNNTNNNSVPSNEIKTDIVAIKKQTEFIEKTLNYDISFLITIKHNKDIIISLIIDKPKVEMYNIKQVIYIPEEIRKYFASYIEYTPFEYPSKRTLEELHYMIPNNNKRKGIETFHSGQFLGNIEDLKDNYIGLKALIKWTDSFGKIHKDFIISTKNNTTLNIITE